MRLWDLQTKNLLIVFNQHQGIVWSVAFSPSGSHIASGSEDQTVRLWEIETQTLVNTLIGHTNRVWEVLFNFGGSQIISADWDGAVYGI